MSNWCYAMKITLLLYYCLLPHIWMSSWISDDEFVQRSVMTLYCFETMERRMCLQIVFYVFYQIMLCTNHHTQQYCTWIYTLPHFCVKWYPCPWWQLACSWVSYYLWRDLDYMFRTNVLVHFIHCYDLRLG